MKKFRFWGLFLSIFLVFTFTGNAYPEEDLILVDPETRAKSLEYDKRAPKDPIKDPPGEESGQREYPAMRPDAETLKRWMDATESAPRAFIDETLEIERGSYNILSWLYYIPQERDQMSCGNCWAWAGTGVMAIDLYRQEEIRDRLSVQYNNSCTPSSEFGCCGGWLSDLADFYSNTSYDQALPWTNTGAHWQDGNCSYGCSPTVWGDTNQACGDIGTMPRYPISFINETVIPTTGEFETPIENIKNILNQGKAVWFGFFMPNSTDWSNFTNFWWNQNENAVWNPDFSCYKTTSQPIGHAVLCVGYNDDDPDNSYWIMLNSWGTNTNRPNGIFRLDMNMDYNCKFYSTPASSWYYSFYWQTLDIDWNIQTFPHPCCNAGVAGCIDPDIKTTICETDSYCCTTWWDELCVNEVTSIYGDTCECCEWHSQSEGCAIKLDTYVHDYEVSDCVCTYDSYCCKYSWDSLCANEVESLDCGCCPPDAPTNPDPANGATNVPVDQILTWNGGPAADPSRTDLNRTLASPDFKPPVNNYEAFQRPELKKTEISESPNPNEQEYSGTNDSELVFLDQTRSVVDCTCSGKYYTGQKIIALVDNPSSSTGIPAGHTGTVICGSTIFPGWILVSWDDWSNGHDGNGYCTCPVSSVPDYSGWWVYCEEIGVAPVDCTCEGKYTTGQKVHLLVDHPAGNETLLAGHTGRVICGTTSGTPTLLISWDNWSDGHDGNGYCTCPVSSAPDNSGWWVYCDQIATCPTTYDVYLGTTGPTELVCADTFSPSCDPGLLAENTKYYWQVVAKNPGGETLGPVWSFTTAEGGCTDPPVISDVSFDGCISELCKSYLCVKAYDPCGGNLNYVWDPQSGGKIVGSGNCVDFYPPNTGPHPCPYYVDITVTSDVSGMSAAQTIPIHVKLAGDVNADGKVNTFDLIPVKNYYGQSGEPGWIDADVNCDGKINTFDLIPVKNQFGQSGCACPK